jgi:SagB-type dehydrogenase family enzyme
VSETPTPISSAQAAPGEATRRYLRALLERRANPLDRRSAAPATYKHYPPAGRLILPWVISPAQQPADPQLALLSILLRKLLGLRTSWAYPTSLAGLSTGAPPSVAVGRAAPSGGALYPIEAYLGTGPAGGRAGALYHYDPAHHCLDLLRAGEHRAAFLSLLTAPPATLPDLVLVLSAVFWRNGVEYGEFAYRLQCQEIGVLTAQALALADAVNLRPAVHLSFADHPTQALLGLDPTSEGPLAILTFTTEHTAQADARPQTVSSPGPYPSVPYPSVPYPSVPYPSVPYPSVPYPSVTDLIARPAIPADNPPPSVTELLPRLLDVHTAAAWCRGDLPDHDLPDHDLPDHDLPDHDITPTPAVQAPKGTVHLPPARPTRLADAIPTRASAPSGYLPTALDPESLATMLSCAAGGYPGDLPGTPDAPISVRPYVLVHRVSGITPGAYQYQADTHTLMPVGEANAGEMVAQGPLQPHTHHALPEAAAVLVPVGDPLAGAPWLGDRWYRIQQIETGIMVHRATLAATTRGLATRIHSEGTNDTTDTALGLHATPLRSLSFLLLGHHRPGPFVRDRPAP